MLFYIIYLGEFVWAWPQLMLNRGTSHGWPKTGSCCETKGKLAPCRHHPQPNRMCCWFAGFAWDDGFLIARKGIIEINPSKPKSKEGSSINNDWCSFKHLLISGATGWQSWTRRFQCSPQAWAFWQAALRRCPQILRSCTQKSREDPIELPFVELFLY